MDIKTYCGIFNDFRNKVIRYVEIKADHYPFRLSLSELSDVGFIASYILEINNISYEHDMYIKYSDLGFSFEDLIKLRS